MLPDDFYLWHAASAAQWLFIGKSCVCLCMSVCVYVCMLVCAVFVFSERHWDAGSPCL
jgi:hypothetical protein